MVTVFLIKCINMKDLIKKRLTEELSIHDLDSMLNDYNKIGECDCCKYFDMDTLSNYGGIEKPLYFLISKREIHTLENIPPKQYIYKIANGFGLSYDDTLSWAYKDEKAVKYAEMMRGGSLAPIGYYVDNKPEQEGRHRASAAMKLDCKSIPVVKISRDVSENYIKSVVLELKGKSREEVNQIYIEKGYKGITGLDWSELNNYINYRL